MKNKNDYWERREQEWIAKRTKKDQEYLKQMVARYDQLANDIQTQINSFYSKYATDTGLTMSDAIKKIKANDVQAFEKTAKKLVENKDFSKEANERLKLYNATMKINRLEYLKAQVGLELTKVTNQEQRAMSDYLESSYIDEVKRQSGILSKHNNVQIAKNARVVASASFHGAVWSDRLWVNQSVLKAKLDNVISRAMIQGTNPTQLIANLRANVAKEVKNATAVIENLVITETARVQDAATMRSLKAAGFKFCKWIAEPTACKYCLEIAERRTDFGIGVYPVDDAPMIPKHPRCRCSKSAHWVDSHVIDTVEDDNKEYKRITDILGEADAPSSLEKFRNLKYNNIEEYEKLKELVIWHQARFPTEKSFNGHFKTHGKEFGDISKEEYQEKAANLLAEPISENILGYETEYRRVRYDIENNIYVLGNPKTQMITTMFKPIGGKDYYDREVEKDLGG